MRKSDKFEIELYDGAICFEGARVIYKSGSYSMPTDDCVLSLSQIDSLAEYFSGIDRKELTGKLRTFNEINILSQEIKNKL